MLISVEDSSSANNDVVKGLLISCNQMSADYLFQTDKCYDVTFDTGDKARLAVIY
jgi:hypothetical protein